MTFVAIILATFASEDLTCLAVGLLIRSGDVDPLVGLWGCFVGIFVGDLGLWLMGWFLSRGLWRWQWLHRRLPERRVAELQQWFDRRGWVAVFAARFLPGTRVPLYMAAGVLGRSPSRFALWTALAVLLWTPLVVLATALLGAIIVRPFVYLIGPGWPALLLGAACLFAVIQLVMTLRSDIGRSKLGACLRRGSRADFDGRAFMLSTLCSWLRGSRRSAYKRRAPLILVNGLAEQAESWYRNLEAWRQQFEVHTPHLLAYEGTALHRRIEERQPIDIDYLVDRLWHYLDEFVQTPPYALVANSLGGKVAVEFAARYPELVSRLVLLCPSGLSDEERLPIVEGVRRNDLRSIVDSVFFDSTRADPRLLAYYQERFPNRRWRTGLLRTIRGTMEHRVRNRLAEVRQPTLLVVGREDRIVDPQQAIDAARLLPHGTLLVLDRCGHAPQIEQAGLVNRLVIDFVRGERSR